MRQIVRRAAFASILISSVLTSLAAAQDAKVEVFLFTPKKFPAGQTTTVILGLREGVVPSTVVFNPPAGVSVGQIERIDQTNSERQSRRRRWTVQITLAQTSPPGLRTSSVLTSEGQASSEEVEVLDHAPEVLEFKVIEVELSPIRVAYILRVRDVKNDLGRQPLREAYRLLCGNEFLVGTMSVDQTGVKAVAESEMLISGEFRDPNARASRSGECELVFTVRDLNGIESEARTTVTFP